MHTSARNLFHGTVTAIHPGSVNSEIELTLAGGDRMTAVITCNSVTELGLTVGGQAVALVKAPWVILVCGASDMRFSARNQLTGIVTAVTPGAVNGNVTLTLPGGTPVHAVVTNAAIQELGLKPGVEATALIKASHIIVGVNN